MQRATLSSIKLILGQNLNLGKMLQGNIDNLRQPKNFNLTLYNNLAHMQILILKF